MATPKVYVICDQNCKYEGLTKEQILTAITQAVNEGTIGDIDTGFVQTIKTINGTALRFFVGEQYEYDALADEDKKSLFAIITNDTTKDGIINAIEALQNEMADFKKYVSNTYLPTAEKAMHINYFIGNTKIFTNTDIYIGESVRSIEEVSTICISAFDGQEKRQCVGVRSGIVTQQNGIKSIDFVVTGGGTQLTSETLFYEHIIAFAQLKEKDGSLYLNINWSTSILYRTTATDLANALVISGIAGDALEYLSVLYD